MSWHVCRICLAGDIKTYTINNTQFQDMYEKITGYKWARHDRPVMICYICVSQLQRSLKFQQMCNKSEEIFGQILAVGFEFTEEILPILYKRRLQTVEIAPLSTLNIELTEVTEIKEEIKEIGNCNKRFKTFSLSPIITACVGNEESFSISKQQKHGVSQMEKHTFFYVHDYDENNDYIADEIKIIDDDSNTQGTPEKMNTNDNSPRKDDIKTDENGSYNHSLLNKNAIVFIPTPGNTDFSSDEYDKSNHKHKTEIITPKNEDKTLTNECNVLPSPPNKNTLRKSIKLTFKHSDIITPRKSIERNAKEKKITHESSKRHGKIEEVVKSDNDKECNKSFTKKGQFLEKYMESKTVDITFTCDICNRSFNIKSSLILHMKIHTDDRQFKCDKCPKTYTHMCYLNKHKLCHLSKKPFVCKICQKGFYQRSHLYQHKRIHTGERPYSCKVCNKQFIQLSHLMQHNRVHSGEKPYSCACGKSFAQMGGLMNHQKIHMMVKPFKCDICASGFNQKNNLKKHLKTVHNLSPSDLK